jgi:TRAP-type C4-dicarboxylate transport system permease small subunit
VTEKPNGPGDGNNRAARFALFTLPRAIIGTLLLIAVAINIANVIGRYMFHASIFWTEEILIYLIIWSVFLGVVAITYRGEHLKLDLASSRLTGKAKTIVNTSIAVTILVCCVVVVAQSLRVLASMAATGQVSIAAGMPMVIPHGALIVGFSLMAVAVLVRLRAYITGHFD